jgi:signal transduction histidine kinase
MYNLYAWLRSHPLLVDGLLALLLFAGSVEAWPTGSGPLTVAVAVLITAVLAGTVLFRRRYPVAAFALAVAIALAQVTLGAQPGSPNPPVRAFQPGGAADLAIAVLLYTVAAYRPRRVSVSALVVCLLGVALAVSRWAPVYGPGPHPAAPLLGATGGLAGVALTAWVLGDSMAYRRGYYAALEDRATRLEAERDAQARIAAAAERARVLQERRALAVDESAARLRRIERDLHDGAQVRLTALALALGEIKENLASAADADSANSAGDDAGRTLGLVTAAHASAKEALTELRDLARGIHPPVLDRGLGPALSSLAEASAVPVALNVTISARPSPAIEAIAYFCAAELLANVTKHSGASRATIGVTDCDGRLIMTVTDNGAGRARLIPGGGLAGLAERVQTVDGKLGIDSPAGGPTIVTVELPGHA